MKLSHNDSIYKEVQKLIQGMPNLQKIYNNFLEIYEGYSHDEDNNTIQIVFILIDTSKVYYSTLEEEYDVVKHYLREEGIKWVKTLATPLIGIINNEEYPVVRELKEAVDILDEVTFNNSIALSDKDIILAEDLKYISGEIMGNLYVYNNLIYLPSEIVREVIQDVKKYNQSQSGDKI